MGNAIELPDLPAQWMKLTQRWEVDRKIAKKEFKILRKQFEIPPRHYHTLGHVQALLYLIDQYEEEMEQPDLLRFSAWYHDVIYDSTRTDNEQASAVFGEEAMGRMAIPEPMIEGVVNLILRTEGHDTQEASVDEAVFLDFDLSILGAPAEIYQRYAQQIREEYAWVNPEAYRAGRKQVLEGFLSRKEIYATSLGAQLWEKLAQENLKRELDTFD